LDINLTRSTERIYFKRKQNILKNATLRGNLISTSDWRRYSDVRTTLY